MHKRIVQYTWVDHYLKLNTVYRSFSVSVNALRSITQLFLLPPPPPPLLLVLPPLLLLMLVLLILLLRLLRLLLLLLLLRLHLNWVLYKGAGSLDKRSIATLIMKMTIQVFWVCGCVALWIVPYVWKGCSVVIFRVMQSKKTAQRSFQTPATTHPTAWRYSPQDLSLQQHRHENPKPCTVLQLC